MRTGLSASDKLTMQETGRRLDTLLSNLSGMAYRCHNDSDYTLEFASEGCTALTGYTPDDLVNKRTVAYGQLIHPADQQQVWEQIQVAIAARQPFDLLYRIHTADGAEKWVMERGCGVFAADGKLVGLEGLISDVTKLKRAQAELLQAHNELAQSVGQRTEELAAALRAVDQEHINFAAVADNANDGVLIAAGSGRHVYANPRAAAIFGYTAEELCAAHFTDLTPPDQHPMLRERYQRRLAGEALSNQYETVIVRKDGQRVPIELTAAKTIWQDQPADLVIVRDISERRVAEEALRGERDLVASVLDTVDALIVVLDSAGRIMRFNHACQRLTGYSWPEVQGRKLGDFLLSPDEQEMVRSAFEQSRQDEQPSKIETHWITKDGRRRLIAWSNAVLQHRSADNEYFLSAGMDITELREVAELRIRDMMLSSSLSAIATVNPAGVITYANPMLLGLWGYAATDEVIGKPGSILWADPQQYQAATHALLADRGWLGELAAVRRDGVRFQAQVAASAVTDLAGTFIGITYSCLDITERKRTEALLHEREREFRALVENSPDIVARFDRDLRHLYVNPAVKLASGIPAVGMIGKSDRELGLPEAQVAFWEERLNQVFATGQSGDIEFGLETPTGLQHYQSRLLPEFDATGEIESVRGVTRNITGRRNTELALRASEERYRRIVETAQEGIWLIDAETRTTFANQAMAAMLGYTVQEMMGAPLFAFMDEEGKALAAYNLERRRQGIAETHEFKFMHKEGRPIWALLNTNPILDDHGQFLGALAMVTDITERKRADAALVAYAADLERSNRDLEQFANVVSHDLQEPLRMVASFVQLLAQDYGGKLDANADEYIGYAVDGAKRMQQLIADLVAYSRISTRGKPLVPIDCAGVVHDVLNSLQLTIEETGARIRCAALPTVMADHMQLYQVFQNLLGNAMKYRSSAPPLIEIGADPVLEESENGRQWRLWVRDNGIGIEPQYCERIFVIFQRLHARDAYPGTGIGLTICKKIIERHGGRIWVDSEPGHGSTFYFTLPAV